MTKLEKNYIETMRNIYKSLMENEKDEKRRNDWFHEWLAVDSILNGLEDKAHMKKMAK